jgi:hypothetical protein
MLHHECERVVVCLFRTSSWDTCKKKRKKKQVFSVFELFQVYNLFVVPPREKTKSTKEKPKKK